jgi:hypothetical protein
VGGGDGSSLLFREADMTRRFLLTAFLLSVVTVSGCTKIYDDDDDEDGPLTTPAPVVKADVIEFRVSGSFPSAIVRHSDSINGLTQVSTGLPYFASVSSTRENIFLSLESSAVGIGNLQIQILVNGMLFRESNSTTFSPALSVNGTYRKP